MQLHKNSIQSKNKDGEIRYVVEAHDYMSQHRTELEKDRICGCFYCMEIYSPKEIKEWVSGDADWTKTVRSAV